MALTTGEIPPALADRPTLQTFDLEVWRAFDRLSSRRPVSGFGSVGAIPYVELVAYLDLIAKIEDEDDRQTFIELIESLDQEFLREYADKQRKEQQKSASKTSSKRKSS